MSLPPISPQPGQKRQRRKKDARQALTEADSTSNVLAPDDDGRRPQQRQALGVDEASADAALEQQRTSTAWSDAAAPLVAERAPAAAAQVLAVPALPGSTRIGAELRQSATDRCVFFRTDGLGLFSIIMMSCVFLSVWFDAQNTYEQQPSLLG